MSAPTHLAHQAPQGFIRKYVFSLDHKVIGIQYYFLGLFSVFLGMSLSLLMRFHMVNPEAKVSWFAHLWPTSAAGGMMSPELYLSLMTMHGTIMVFFVLTNVSRPGGHGVGVLRARRSAAVGLDGVPAAERRRAHHRSRRGPGPDLVDL